MDTALLQKFPFILDRNLAKANCTGNQVYKSCDTVVIGSYINSLQRIIIIDIETVELSVNDNLNKVNYCCLYDSQILFLTWVWL